MGTINVLNAEPPLKNIVNRDDIDHTREKTVNGLLWVFIKLNNNSLAKLSAGVNNAFC